DIFVAGLSMGGTITLELALRHADRLAGIVLVNPFVYTTDPRAKLAPLLGKFPLLLKGVYDDVAEPGRHELGYPKVSTKTSASVLEFGASVRSRLAQVRVPALVFASRQDHVVHPGNASLVVETIGSESKELVWLERSFHVATLDYDRHLIFERSAKFIAEHAKG
ncbi:MAG: alpha/beta hydrolase, partial [Actinomycetota bacterium]